MFSSPRKMALWLFPLFIIFPLALMLSASPESVGSIAEKGGEVSMQHAGKKSTATLGNPIFLQDVIQTGKKKSWALLAFQDATKLTLYESTKLLVTQVLLQKRTRETVFDISFGKLKAQIQSKYDKKKSKTEFRTPTAIVGIRGTTVTLTVSAKKTVACSLEGSFEAFHRKYPERVFGVSTGQCIEFVAGERSVGPELAPKDKPSRKEEPWGPTGVGPEEPDFHPVPTGGTPAPSPTPPPTTPPTSTTPPPVTGPTTAPTSTTIPTTPSTTSPTTPTPTPTTTAPIPTTTAPTPITTAPTPTTTAPTPTTTAPTTTP